MFVEWVSVLLKEGDSSVLPGGWAAGMQRSKAGWSKLIALTVSGKSDLSSCLTAAILARSVWIWPPSRGKRRLLGAVGYGPARGRILLPLS